MKRIILIMLVLLAGIGGWLYFFERELLDEWMGKQPASVPAPATSKATVKKAPRRKPVPVSKPEKAKLVMANLTIPSTEASVFVNGAAVEAGSQLQIPAGISVVASYNNDGSFSHELIKSEAEGAYSAQLARKTAEGSASWATFQGNEARTGFVSARQRTSFEPVWQVDLKDKVECSPVLIGETAFLSSRKSLITAIDLKKGAVLWKKGVSGSAISPIATEMFIFAANNMGQFGGYRQEDGKQKGELFLNSYPTGLALVSAEAFLVSTIENKIFSVKTKKSWATPGVWYAMGQPDFRPNVKFSYAMLNVDGVEHDDPRDVALLKDTGEKTEDQYQHLWEERAQALNFNVFQRWNCACLDEAQACYPHCPLSQEPVSEEARAQNPELLPTPGCTGGCNGTER